jgi:ammonium transporter
MRPFLLAAAAALCLLAANVPAFADDSTTDATSQETTAEATSAKLDTGDTAWMLVSTGLVLFMVPGLALFYGGMVRRKNVLGTMMHSMVALAIIGIQWVLFGYALAFGKSQHGLIGWDTDLLGLWKVDPDRLIGGGSIPVYVHCMYQGMFAIITPALISGAVAERVRFGPYCLFIFLWGALVYVPLAHWVWAFDDTGAPAGWLGNMGVIGLKGRGALDFAGGTVVHIAAGVSGLAAILLLRKRIGYPEHAMHPNSMVLTLTGAGLLWFGWFGFNGGSALHANGQAASALAASQTAAAAAALTWMVAEWLHKGKPTALGFASGLVAGLVAITPASGFVLPMPAMAIGALAGVICYGAVCLKPLLKYDDSLDAFGVHGVGGFLGAILTGVFASNLLVWHGTQSYLLPDGNPGGAIYDGHLLQIGIQFLAATVAVVFAFVVTLVLVKLVDATVGFTLDAKSEGEGVDRSEHGEVGFDLGLAMEAAAEAPVPEPRPAMIPPNGKRHFTIVVDGVPPRELLRAWSALCQTGAKPPSPEFKAVYPFVTTVQGNRFHFRGGDPVAMREAMKRLFENALDGASLHTHVEDSSGPPSGPSRREGLTACPAGQPV